VVFRFILELLKIQTYILSAYMLQNGLGLLRSVFRFFSGFPPARDEDEKTILNKYVRISHVLIYLF
jgi:hypothetical protein